MRDRSSFYEMMIIESFDLHEWMAEMSADGCANEFRIIWCSMWNISSDLKWSQVKMGVKKKLRLFVASLLLIRNCQLPFHGEEVEEINNEIVEIRLSFIQIVDERTMRRVSMRTWGRGDAYIRAQCYRVIVWSAFTRWRPRLRWYLRCRVSILNDPTR